MLRYATCQLWALEPIRKTPASAGLDLFSPPESTRLHPGEIVTVNTGLVFEIPDGWFGLLKLRSSFARDGLSIHEGVIDSDYRGELLVLLRNNGKEVQYLPPSIRYVQLLIVPCLLATPERVPMGMLTNTQRATGGFGSTGKF